MVVVGATVVVGGAVVVVLDVDVVVAPTAGPATVAASAESATTTTVAAARACAPPIRRGSMPAGGPERYAGLSHPAAVALPVRLTELELLELPGGGAGQRVAQLDRRRALEVRQPAAAVLQERRLVDGRARRQHHQRLHRLAPLVVGHADDGRFGDLRVRAQG